MTGSVPGLKVAIQDTILQLILSHKFINTEGSDSQLLRDCEYLE